MVTTTRRILRLGARRNASRVNRAAVITNTRFAISRLMAWYLGKSGKGLRNYALAGPAP